MHCCRFLRDDLCVLDLGVCELVFVLRLMLTGDWILGLDCCSFCLWVVVGSVVDC